MVAKKMSGKITEEMIRAYALEDAINHSGKSLANSVLGKLFLEGLKKENIREAMPLIQKIVLKVNSMSLDEQKEEFEESKKMVKERVHEQKEGLSELPDAKAGKVVMRFAPSPSGPLHIGHAYPLSLNIAYCEQYGGKLIIRIEDTNPENIDPISYKMIPEDAAWLSGNKVDKVYIQSDRMEIYYKYAERCVKEGFAYVCTCSQEEFKEHSEKMKDCPCRNLPVKEQLERWKKMFTAKEGWAVVRIKTSMKDKNPAMRDWPALRINQSPHPRVGKKYQVWPLMNFSVTVDDIEMGVTHTLRGKDHVDNAKRQDYLFKYLKHKSPTHLFVGRINFTGMSVSCSDTKKMIKEGKFSGWDDIRLPFLLPLRKKGYLPGALRKFAEGMGLNLVDKTVSREDYFQLINSYNRDLINDKSNRYFFVHDPQKIKVAGAPKVDAEIGLHPSFPERGVRKFKTGGEFYVANDDLSFAEGKVYRLMDCINFAKKGNKLIFDSKEYQQFKDKGEKILHWLPADEKQIAKIKVLMDDGKYAEGYAEKSVLELKEDTRVQFERFGFCIKRGKNEFWFTHK